MAKHHHSRLSQQDKRARLKPRRPAFQSRQVRCCQFCDNDTGKAWAALCMECWRASKGLPPKRKWVEPTRDQARDSRELSSNGFVRCEDIGVLSTGPAIKALCGERPLKPYTG